MLGSRFSGLAVLVLAAILVGCGKGGFSERVNEGKENVLRYALSVAPTSLDPAVPKDNNTWEVLHQVFEGLVGVGEGGEIQPVLAEKWTVSPDGLTYRFTLKQGVKFHNGRTVVAEDVKWSLERALNPKISQGAGAIYLDDILGAKELFAGKASTLEGARVVDERTLEIRLVAPRPYFLGKFAQLASSVLPKEAVPADREITDIKQMVGTGPYRLTSYVESQRIVFEPNADYHQGRPSIDRIERPLVPDPPARMARFKNGELDLLFVTGPEVRGVQSNPDLAKQIRKMPRASNLYIGFQVKHPSPVRDVRVRRAIAMAIDREWISREITGDAATLAHTFLPPAIPGARPKGALPDYNPEAARRLLAEAGFPGGRGFPSIPLACSVSNVESRAIAEAVAMQVEKELGVKIAVQPMEFGALLEAVEERRLPMFYLGWIADYLDPQNFLSTLFRSDSPSNNFGYSDSEVDRLTSLADASPDPEERMRLYAEVEDRVLRDVVVIPLAFPVDPFLVSPRLSGIQDSGLGLMPFRKVQLKP